MYQAVKGTKICYIPRMFKLIVNRSCVQMEYIKQKEIFHLVDLITKQWKQSFGILESKNVSIASTVNSSFQCNRQCQC